MTKQKMNINRINILVERAIFELASKRPLYLKDKQLLLMPLESDALDKLDKKIISFDLLAFGEDGKARIQKSVNNIEKIRQEILLTQVPFFNESSRDDEEYNNMLKICLNFGLLPIFFLLSKTTFEQKIGNKDKNIFEIAVSDFDFLQEKLKPELKFNKCDEVHLPIDGDKSASLNIYSDFFRNSHLVLKVGEPELMEYPPIRFHSKCITGDFFSSLRCDCGSQLLAAKKYILNEKGGYIFYLDQEGRGIGIHNKIRAYHKQDEYKVDTVVANQVLGLPDDFRSYQMSKQILNLMKIKKFCLLTNNPLKIDFFKRNGFDITLGKIVSAKNEFNSSYLKTKEEKMGHTRIQRK